MCRVFFFTFVGFHGKSYARECLDTLNQRYLKQWLQRAPEIGDEEDIFDIYQTILLHQVKQYFGRE